MDQPGTSSLERAVERLAALSWLWVSGFVLLFLPLTVYLSSHHPIWYDEVYTINISRLPTIGDIWSELAAGADLHPPAIYIATRLAQALAGSSEWALRLPSTLGVLLMGLSIMIFLARRMNALWGFVGATFALMTGIYPHAFEARPYGMVLGLAALSLVCWQLATEGRFRKFALVAMSASLMLAVGSHYFAILLFFPLAVGELVRNWINRRIDWPVWASILVAAPAVLLFLPLVQHTLPAVANEKTSQVKLSVLWTAYTLLESAQVALAFITLLVITLVWNYLDARGRRLSLPLHEAAAALGLVAIPVPGMALALTVTHNLTERYVLPLTVGAALLFAMAAYRLTGGSPTAALILAAVLAGVFGAHTLSRARSESIKGAGAVMTDPHNPNLPIVISSALAFLPTWYYASPELRSRLVFVADDKRALYYRNNDQSNSAMPFEGRLFQMPVLGFDEFRQAHRCFLLNWHEEDSWLLYAYRDLGAQVEVLKASGDDYLLLVTDPER